MFSHKKSKGGHRRNLTFGLSSFFAFFVSILVTLFSCAESENRLRIAAASNLQQVMVPLVEAFKENSSYDETFQVDLIYASSGTLTNQIRSGAPFDLFLSADLDRPQSLFKEGYGTAPPQIYAKGFLILALPQQNLEDLSLESWFPTYSVNDESRPVLGEHELSLILTNLNSHNSPLAMANPVLAPYGKASDRVLSTLMKTEDPSIVTTIVMGENISQTLQFTMNGASAGFLAGSQIGLLENPRTEQSNPENGLGDNLLWFKIDPNLHDPIDQAALLLHADSQSARAFMEFLSHPTAKEIFHGYGYL